MLYTVSASGIDRKRLDELMPKSYVEIVHEHPNYIVFYSPLEWGHLREALNGFVVGVLNPDCELGKEIVKKMKASRMRSEVKEGVE